MTLQKQKPQEKRDRKGTAVAELAVCLPAITLLVLGALECTTMTFVRQSLHITAYEGVRVAIRNDTTTTDVRDRCARILNERSINGAQVVVTPNATESVPRGDNISVAISAPCDSNNALPLKFFSGNTLRGAAIMVKE
jgi:Flp pilus assembly protein TadG